MVNELVRMALMLGILCGLIVGGAWLFKGTHVVTIEATDASMAASGYPPGRYKIDDTLAGIADLNVGDVVAYRVPSDLTLTRVAKIVAREGQSVAVAGDTVSVDGKRLGLTLKNINVALEEFRLPRASVFVMTDDPAVSQDSVREGPIPFDLILGRLK